MKLLICLAILVSMQNIEGAKILAVFPFPGPSHYILVQPYLKALAARGHKLTVINAFPQQQPIKNYRDILVKEVRNDHENIIETATMGCGKWKALNCRGNLFLNITQTVLKNPAVQKLLQEESFDLIVLEVLHTDAWYALGRHFGAPMIGISSFGTDVAIDELMGNISPLSYSPLVAAGFTEYMSYLERFENVLLSLLELLYIRLYILPQQREILKTYLPHIVEDIWDLRTNFSLMLLNQHFSLSYPRPYVPNMIEVGGFQIQFKAQSLPKEIMEFIESSNEDIIYFSMGSNVKSKHFPPAKLQIINEIFASLPYKILWKFENKTLKGKPRNVFISSWYPQSDVLAHPRVKLFISHGGLLSTTEAIYHGKPMLGLPVFYDQHMNIRKAVQAGFALKIDFQTLPGKEFKPTILEMMNNPKYIKRAREISKIHHDQPVKPLDLAIYWTEYVLRHQGAVHLQNPAQKMNFIQKHSLDTAGVLVALLVGSGVVLFFAIWKIILIILKTSSGKKQKTY